MSEQVMLQLEAYLKGELGKEDEAWVAQQIASQESWASSYEIMRFVQDQGKAETEAFKRQLESLHTAYLRKHPKGKMVRLAFPPFRVAAIIVLLLSIGLGGILLGLKGHSPESLYAEYYQKPDFSYVRGTEGLQDKTQAIMAYEQGSYAEALPHFENWLRAHPDDTEMMFYAAVAYLEAGAYDEAIAHFQQLIQRKASLHAQQAPWFLALTHLKKGQTQLAKDLLQKQLQERAPYPDKKKIQDLLAALESVEQGN
ncbi:MAG: tetratricopeptide repeat protein [Bacteroidota bacterium]